MNYWIKDGRTMLLATIRAIIALLGLAFLFGIIASRAYSQMTSEQGIHQILNERGLENRVRIQALESTQTSLLQKLTKIEAELEMTRRNSEDVSNRIWMLIAVITPFLLKELIPFASYLLEKKPMKGDHFDE